MHPGVSSIARRLRVKSLLLIAAFAPFTIGCASVRLGISSSPFPHFPLTQKLDANGVPTWAILPPSYNPQVATPWIIYNHGFGQTIDSIAADVPQSRFIMSLAEAGFVVVASDYRNLACWGNSQCAEDVANLQTLWKSQLNLMPKPFVIGESMGGIVTWNAISHGALSPAAVVGIYPVCNLAAMNKNSVFLPTIQSAFGFTSQAQYPAATEGYDPLLTPASKFAGFPIVLWASHSDHVVVRSSNEDPFARAIRVAGGNITIYSSAGEHGDPSNFDAPAVISLFRGIEK